MDLSKVSASMLLALSGFVAVCGLGLGAVVINEVELSPPDNATLWVEIYNTGNDTVDLTGWAIKIEDKPWVGQIPLSGAIGPDEFRVGEGQSAWIETGNGTVTLYDSAGGIVDRTPRLSDRSHTDFTYGRLQGKENADSRADFAFMFASKGRPNIGGKIG